MANKDPHALSYFQVMASSIARMGALPEHIAIIMDGNRRYARSKGIKIAEGHEIGADKLYEVRSWAKAIGLKELTVYGFSSENFKRSKEEVDDLMNLFHDQFTGLLVDIEASPQPDTCVQVIGDLDRVPAKLRYRLATIMERTRYYKPFKVNFAIGYTGREGILRSLKTLSVSAHKDDENCVHPSQVNEHLIDQAQYINDMLPVDMLIRTGGDKRLSDFMMWEAAHAYIHFIPRTWPEFSFLDFMHAIFMFQREHKKIQTPMLTLSPAVGDKEWEKVLEKSRTERWNRVGRLAKRDGFKQVEKKYYQPDLLLDFLKDSFMKF